MSRPTQRLDGVVRSIRQPVAFSLIEYGQLQRSAYENNMSVSELIRWRCLTRKELGSINVNMKQLAKKLPTITDRLLNLIGQVRQTQIHLVGASLVEEDSTD
jgi:hypothetical protein